MSISRRYFIASSAAFPGLAQPTPTPLKIVVAGGHPGDPECGCAGSIARFTGTGHQVVLLYLNRGDGYCGAAPRNNCASIRTAEAQEACRILKARAAFGGQIDGQSVIDAQRHTAFDRVVSEEKPDVVFTQWPIDRHRDHRAVSMLTLDAWWKAGQGSWEMWTISTARKIDPEASLREDLLSRKKNQTRASPFHQFRPILKMDPF